MKNEDFIAFVDVLTNLAELHEWEIKNFPLLNSLTGRLLYYRIAQRAIQSEKNHTNTIKDLTGDSGFTEKSLRNRMNEMENEEFIYSVQNSIDGRSKFPIPKEKFLAAMYFHASQARKILEKDFILIKKNDSKI
jgi:hypothetical protein